MLNSGITQNALEALAKAKWSRIFYRAVQIRLEILGIELTELGLEHLRVEISHIVEESYEKDNNTWAEGIFSIVLEYSEDEFASDTSKDLLESFQLQPNDVDQAVTELREIFKQVDDEISIAEYLADKVYLSWKQVINTVIQTQADERNAFQASLYRLWEQPLILLETLLSVSFELYREHLEKLNIDGANNYSHLTDALIRLYARGHQTAGEIMTLLMCGYADGAMARWRTLHEIVVTASFIVKYGEVAAEPFLDYLFVDNYKASKEYQKHAKSRGWDEIPQDELDFHKKQYDRVKNKYGKSFVTMYGWTKHILSDRSVTFKDIVEHLNLDYLRPNYLHGNWEVHASAMSMLVRLGLQMNPYTEQILAGASAYGLATPGRMTASSLAHLSSVFLNHKASPDTAIVLRALVTLRNEVMNEFDKAEMNLDQNIDDST